MHRAKVNASSSSGSFIFFTNIKKKFFYLQILFYYCSVDAVRRATGYLKILFILECVKHTKLTSRLTLVGFFMAITLMFHRLNFTSLVLVQVNALIGRDNFVFMGDFFFSFLSFIVVTRFSLFYFLLNILPYKVVKSTKKQTPRKVHDDCPPSESKDCTHEG
jgi:hypothetical protein